VLEGRYSRARLPDFRQQNGLLERQPSEDPVRRAADVRRGLLLGDGLRMATLNVLP
jgi:hypothetical protein